MSIHASDASVARAASYGVRMTGIQHDYTTPEGQAYLDAVFENDCLNWADRRLRKITILRLLSDFDCPFWDVSYCHGEDVDGKPCRVSLPFNNIPKGRGRFSKFIIEEAKRDGVFAKGLGIFDAISTLQ